MSAPGDGERRNGDMTPEDALSRMANVTRMTRGLRVRTEGLTLFLFAICMMASYLTIVVPILFGHPGDRFGHAFDGSFNNSTGPGPGPGGPGEHHPPPTQFFLLSFTPLLWFVIATLGAIAVWRSASLSFPTGLTTPRLLAVLVGWMALFVLVTVLLTFVQGGNPRSWHLVAWGFVFGLFALLNPLRFTTPGRLGAAATSVVAFLTALYAFVAHLEGRDVGFLTGLALGVPGIVAGLWLMFRG
jgi:hypothetical protein